MSPFAAGCAICGADLDTKRWDTGPSVINRAGSWFNALSLGPIKGGPWVLLVVLFLLFFGSSIVSYVLYAL